jgi:predicted membrane protein
MEHQGAMIPTRRGKRRRAGMARFRRLPLVFSISLCFLLFFHSSSVQAVGLSERWVNGLIEMWGIAYGNGTFVAVGWDTSPDVYDEIF